MRVERERALRARRASAVARRSPSYNPSMGSCQTCGVHRHARDSDANNGNWRTAARWAAMLRAAAGSLYRREWDGRAADALIALHARRSAASIARFRVAHPIARVAVVLTGTDLYRDLPGDREAARSLDLADRIVVLQEDALRIARRPLARARPRVDLPVRARRCAPRRKPPRRLDCVAGRAPARREGSRARSSRRSARLPGTLPIRLRHYRRAARRGARPRGARARSARSALSLLGRAAPRPRRAPRSSARTCSSIPRSWRAART